MRRVMRGRSGMVLAFVLGLVIATAGTAGAARLITGKQIKDGSISEKDLSKALRKALKATGKAGPQGVQGPQGAKGDPGAGLGAPTVVTVASASQDSPTQCLGAMGYDMFCGSIGSGKYWAATGGPNVSPFRYSVQAGYVQFEGAVVRVGDTSGLNPEGEFVFYLPPDRKPASTLRFPVAKVDEPGTLGQTPASSPAFVRVDDLGGVYVIGAVDGDRFDLSGIRFRAKPTG